ncbi:MAG: tRNA preQ1(34) S-adenosylmethionine ribosyltransferase-isomerase QueA [Sedimentisphaerales bacterium]|nr:tRNA preQ1(34) S-adenosylmethionine ribosyltransferase-isomerase QueA [Sedimentisphaerales bacterium]
MVEKTGQTCYCLTMRTEELVYELPPDLIAQHPADRRDRSRLLVLERDSGRLTDRLFFEIGDYFRSGDCLVLNNTKVLPARFFARRPTGARIEGLYLDCPQAGQWEVMLKNARRIRPGQSLMLLDRDGRDIFTIRAGRDLGQGRWLLDLPADSEPVLLLERIGFAPLPPYIKRPFQYRTDQALADLERYQTVFAQTDGAVAAPTAGLHFTPSLLEALKRQGIFVANVTLHVGAGTFKPVAAEHLEDHDIHAEWYQLDQANAEIINNSIENGGRIIPVGTTSVRTLETVAKGRRIDPGSGNTRLYILPGYRFQVVDGMLTNFHLPRSTLLALVGAFAGMETIRTAYRYAIEKRYRFYSYGDAMLIL